MNITASKQTIKTVKTKHYASARAFLHSLVRRWHEEKLYRTVMKSKKEFAAGKGKLLKHVSDLDR